jgi:phosphatidylserine/phosphatidylglycerophosphate/cardiolipin synthase-like enzyme
MRFKSKKKDGFQVFAVTGVNTVSFGITSTAAARKGLLGFAVERVDAQRKQRFFMQGMKVFRSVIPNPDKNTRVSTWDHPIQSFVWDDFTARDSFTYTYNFYPVRGQPKNLDRNAQPLSIEVTTEKLFSGGKHDIFFNRGVASSQAYAREFRNVNPLTIEDPKERGRALQWLSRDLDEAMVKFIKSARAGDELLGCFYEFRYEPVAKELKAALARKVKLRLIVDTKDNSRTDKKTGKFHEAFPRTENLAMLKAHKFPKASVVHREMRPSDIQHNKFMVLRRKNNEHASEVWTGSTNLSMGGIHGQTNVGHWVRDDDIAEAFRNYWNILAADPGAAKGEGSSAEGRAANRDFTDKIEALSPTLQPEDEVASGVTAIFSPRRGQTMLQSYVTMLAGASSHACITLAFGVGEDFRKALLEHDSGSPLTFLLLEKEDRPNQNSSRKDEWLPVNAKNNVYKAFGSYLSDGAVYQFARETNARALALNVHVAYIHSKFMLVDPLGDDPVVVTGSANFSEPSTTGNDENMLIIRGDQRVADIYFTEFNRLFFHYYYRSVVTTTERLRANKAVTPPSAPQFLEEDPRKWLDDYAPGKFKDKRVAMFAGMAV